MATPAQIAYSKRNYAIQEALRPVEKDLIKFYELQWFLRNRVPTLPEVVNHLRTNCKIKRPQLRQTSVNFFLTRPIVRKSLKAHGIPFEQHTVDEITDQQQAAALTVANFTDKRPIAEKLDQLGILPATYYAWLNDPAYRNLVQTMADQNMTNVDPIAKTEFVKKVQDGDWNAIKLYMEQTGTLKNNETPQSEIIIMKLIEILQIHIQDANVLGAIANDMIAAFSNRTLQTAPGAVAGVLTGEFSDTSSENQMELDFAKKQLGI
jgi:hypothetical protein